MHRLLLLILAVGTLSYAETTRAAQDTRTVNPRTISTSRRWSLQPRQTTNNHTAFSQTCNTYYSANTPHAVCNGDRSIMCLSGCTGGIVAQNCRSNSTSIPTTQTCSVAFSQTSETSFLCNTPEGAFTCEGPNSGNIACHGCVPTPVGVAASNSSLIVNGTSMTGAPESHLSTVSNQQESVSSTTSNRLFTRGPQVILSLLLLLSSSTVTLLY